MSAIAISGGVQAAIDEAHEALLIMRYPSLGSLETARLHLDAAQTALAGAERPRVDETV